MENKEVQARIDKFHSHLDACGQCRNHPFDLCAVGATLLKEAATGHAHYLKNKRSEAER